MAIITNRKAYHEYFVEDKIEAGLVLQGWEVKALRSSRVSLDGAYISHSARTNEFFLVKAKIIPHENASKFEKLDDERPRKLLLSRHEINKLFGKQQLDGFTLIPLSIYLKKNILKLELGICKGKKLYDKREAAKTKDTLKLALQQIKSGKVSV